MTDRDHGLLQPSPERFFPGPPEEALGLAVPSGHDAPRVHGDHGVQSRADDGTGDLLACRQRLLGGLSFDELADLASDRRHHVQEPLIRLGTVREEELHDAQPAIPDLDRERESAPESHARRGFESWEIPVRLKLRDPCGRTALPDPSRKAHAALQAHAAAQGVEALERDAARLPGLGATDEVSVPFHAPERREDTAEALPQGAQDPGHRLGQRMRVRQDAGDGVHRREPALRHSSLHRVLERLRGAGALKAELFPGARLLDREGDLGRDHPAGVQLLFGETMRLVEVEREPAEKRTSGCNGQKRRGADALLEDRRAEEVDAGRHRDVGQHERRRLLLGAGPRRVPLHLAAEFLGEISPRLEAQLTIEVVEKHGGAVGAHGLIEAIESDPEDPRFRAGIGRLGRRSQTPRVAGNSFGHFCERLQVLEGGTSSVSTSHTVSLLSVILLGQ